MTADKLGKLPEIVDVNMHEILRVLANYVEYGIKNSKLPQEKIDAALLDDGFLATHVLSRLLYKHLNLMKQHSTSAKTLTRTVIQVLIDLEIVKEIVHVPTAANKSIVTGYKTLPIKQLRELADNG